MNSKMLGGLLLVLGLVFVAASLIVMFVVVPGMKQFPDDVDTTRLYEGEMPVMFNPTAMEFLPPMDITLERHFMTEDTDGDIALVKEEQTMFAGDQVLQHFVKHYAIDRKTMEVVDEYPDSWAEKEGFWDREGLVLGWPIDTEKTDYVGWSDDYRATVDLKFDAEVTHERTGLETYHFVAASPAQLIVPEAVEAMGLPAGLPKDAFTALVGQTDMPDMVKNLLPNLLENIPGDTVPLEYYYAYEGDYWIEPETGVLIDTRKHELRTVGLAESVIEGSPLAALPEEQRANLRVTVSDFTYQGTDESVQEAKEDAQDAKDQIQLYGTTLPIVGIVIGLLFGIAGAFLFMKRS